MVWIRYVLIIVIGVSLTSCRYTKHFVKDFFLDEEINDIEKYHTWEYCKDGDTINVIKIESCDTIMQDSPLYDTLGYIEISQGSNGDANVMFCIDKGIINGCAANGDNCLLIRFDGKLTKWLFTPSMNCTNRTYITIDEPNKFVDKCLKATHVSITAPLGISKRMTSFNFELKNK